MKKNDITDLCGKIAEDYEDWQYVAGIFKNKNLKHTVKIMDPRWSFQPQSVLMQPITIVLNKKIAALKKKYLTESLHLQALLSIINMLLSMIFIAQEFMAINYKMVKLKKRFELKWIHVLKS